MKEAIAIIGAAFGDEGKGMMTNHFASLYKKDCLVVRHNGSAQASHTVVMPNGRRHVFAHIGSGAFYDAATFLSGYFVCHPILFNREWQVLENNFSITPTVYVDPFCLVTTPYDMLLNQLLEKSRGNSRHGSCGVGFGETIERDKTSKYCLCVNDMVDQDFLFNRLQEIRRDYVPARLSKLGIEIPAEYREILDSTSVLNNFIGDCQFFLRKVTPCLASILQTREAVIFEGSQGILLDQNFRFFPHVTRSNTGIENVLRLVGYVKVECLDIVYVTRAYTTRHGAGPLPHELVAPPYPRAIDRTNVTNEAQGPPRFSYLNLDLLQEALAYDMTSITDSRNLPEYIRRQIAITCMDHLFGVMAKYILDNKIKTASYRDIPQIVSEVCGLPVRYLGFSPIGPINAQD